MRPEGVRAEREPGLLQAEAIGWGSCIEGVPRGILPLGRAGGADSFFEARMQYRVFAIPATGSPDLEEELNGFLRAKKVVSVQKVLQEVDGVPRWCFCVEYLDGARPPGGGPSGGRSKRVDYKEVLSEEDFAVFARLRDVRKALATQEAVPVYAVCTNEQLAAIASKRPVSVAALKEIDGLGEAKVGKYGEAFVAALAVEKGDDEADGEPD